MDLPKVESMVGTKAERMEMWLVKKKVVMKVVSKDEHSVAKTVEH